MRQICATCNFFETKLAPKSDQRDGYCYGNPPMLGFTRPKVRALDRACSLYKAGGK